MSSVSICSTWIWAESFQLLQISKNSGGLLESVLDLGWLVCVGIILTGMDIWGIKLFKSPIWDELLTYSTALISIMDISRVFGLAGMVIPVVSTNSSNSMLISALLRLAPWRKDFHEQKPLIYESTMSSWPTSFNFSNISLTLLPSRDSKMGFLNWSKNCLRDSKAMSSDVHHKAILL